MSVRDLIPWGRDNGNRTLTTFRDDTRDPFLSLHREVNRLFDDALRGFDSRLPSLGRFSSSFGSGNWPSVEISDEEKEIRVTAEIPGLEEKDIEVLLDDGVLTLKGEKRSETEDKQFSERFYGRFERRIPLGYEVKDNEADAVCFRNGVLTVTLPKSEKAQSQVKRIVIKS